MKRNEWRASLDIDAPANCNQKELHHPLESLIKAERSLIKAERSLGTCMRQSQLLEQPKAKLHTKCSITAILNCNRIP